MVIAKSKGSTRHFTFSLPVTHGASHNNPSADQHEILDDVLPLKGGREWKLRKADLWKQDER
jgi:hypothetical protein